VDSPAGGDGTLLGLLQLLIPYQGASSQLGAQGLGEDFVYRFDICLRRDVDKGLDNEAIGFPPGPGLGADVVEQFV